MKALSDDKIYSFSYSQIILITEINLNTQKY